MTGVPPAATARADPDTPASQQTAQFGPAQPVGFYARPGRTQPQPRLRDCHRTSIDTTACSSSASAQCRSQAFMRGTSGVGCTIGQVSDDNGFLTVFDWAMGQEFPPDFAEHVRREAWGSAPDAEPGRDHELHRAEAHPGVDPGEDRHE